MNRILFFLLCCATVEAYGQALQLNSPDNKIKVRINTLHNLSYDVLVDEKPVVSKAIVDMQLQNNMALSKGLALKSRKTNRVNTTIIAQVPVSRINIPDNYNELVLNFRNQFSVLFRAYNDGVAYRIATNFRDSITVVSETASFHFDTGAHAWAPVITKREGQDVFHTSFEEPYLYKSLDSLSHNDYMYSPVLVNTAQHLKVAITESDLDDYPGMFLKGNAGSSLEGVFAPYPQEETIADGEYAQAVATQRSGYLARTSGVRHFPWRVLIIAREDKDLPTNDLVYRLAPSSKIKDASWIRPGKATDEWIIDINLFNVPFKSGINTETYKYYIDFAKQFGFDRIMMDAGWSNTRNLFDINPNINMDTLAAYARERGIRLSMWTLALTLNQQLDSALRQFQKWGVDFIMTDFIDRDDQKSVNLFKRITEACAQAKIMIMFHGCYPPKGFNRTYPNNITREAVLGSEYNAWSNKVTAAHNATLPFTRMLAGPLDYEPGLLDNATPQQFRPIWGKVMSQTTRSQQLALFVIYDSPMQLFSGNPAQGYREPAFMHLLGSLPTTWDTTLVTHAKIGEYIVTARRTGDDWYIAGITGATSQDLTVPLAFLPNGKYIATLCKDGINADRNAVDYVIEEKILSASDTIPVHMAPAGGFLIRLKKQ